MSWVAAAIGGSAVVSGGLGYLGANSAAKTQADSADKALAFQKQAYNEQRDWQKQVYGDQQAALSPYKQAGGAALGQISDLYGLGGGQAFGPEAMARFKNSPDYAFAFNQGQDALQNSAAARGGLLSGNFARAAEQYGQGYATNYLKNYTDRLMGIAQGGQNAALGGGQLAGQGAGQLGQFTGQMSGQIGSSYGNMGAANASGIVGGTNAATGAIGSGVQNYLLVNALNNRSSYSPNQGYYGGSPETNPNLNPSTYNYG